MRYLKGISGYFLCYEGDYLHVDRYLDVDWIGDLDEQKSIFGYVCLLNNGTIYWNSKKQTRIALSTINVEFMAYSSAVQEVIWLRRFVQGLEIVGDLTIPVTVHSDSQATLVYVKIQGIMEE